MLKPFEHFEREAVQKCVNLVDVEQCCKKHDYLLSTMFFFTKWATTLIASKPEIDTATL